MSKTKKLMAGVATSILALGMTGCSQNETNQDEPTGYDCDDWEWDDDEGTYYCDDTRSAHYGGYYFLGNMFSSKSAFKKSSGYSSHISSYKSGIGSGTKGGFGG
ncbi:hypothetical protein [Paenisporosarcina quisquiliarum]|uniref:hypothetical protein n=1 Tax=Paenisporosarcina quisquiliarum TaxID=365346 RepID=UPI0037361CAA